LLDHRKRWRRAPARLKSPPDIFATVAAAVRGAVATAALRRGRIQFPFRLEHMIRPVEPSQFDTREGVVVRLFEAVDDPEIHERARKRRKEQIEVDLDLRQTIDIKD
jgi:hypothetical protein